MSNLAVKFRELSVLCEDIANEIDKQDDEIALVRDNTLRNEEILRQIANAILSKL